MDAACATPRSSTPRVVAFVLGSRVGANRLAQPLPLGLSDRIWSDRPDLAKGAPGA